MKNRRNIALTLLSTLFLVILPTHSQADSCSDIKEQYWNCVRASMNNQSCGANVSIPPECLKSGAEIIQNYNSSEPASSFFGTQKESTPFVYQPDSDLPPKKPVKVINIKPTNGKIYLETEEDVNQYTTKIKDDLSEAIKEGKRIRLQFQ